MATLMRNRVKRYYKCTELCNHKLCHFSMKN